MSGLPDYTKGVRVTAGSIPSQRIGSLSIIVKTYGTLTASRSPGGTLAGARNAGSITRGTLSTSRYAGGTLAGARNAGSLTRGTLNNLRLPRSISIGTITAWVNAGSLNRGSVPTNRYVSSGTLAGARNAGSLVRGTLDNLRLPRRISVGTLSGLFNAGSLNRGTIPAAQIQLLPNIPGTLSIVTKTSGTINIATRALGTLANQRLPRNISVGTLSGLSNAGSLNRGTIPAKAMQLLQNVPGTLKLDAVKKVAGTLGVNRGPSQLGTALKQSLFTVSMPGIVGLNPGVTARAFKMQVPAGKTLKVWAMGVDQGAGTALASFGSLFAGVFSVSANTYYRRGTANYAVGSPLVKVPSGTQVEFNVANQTTAVKSPTAFFMASLE